MAISRRGFIGMGLGAGAAAALTGKSLGLGYPSGTTERPNVLMIITDEQSLWTIGRFGGKLPGTPNIDSIGRRGATLRNFFVTSAVCTPSRGCYFTGQYPHTHGAWHNDLPLNPDSFTLGHMFANAGYETGYAGKWHLDGKNDPSWPDWIPDARAMGFQDHEWMFNQGHWKRIVERPEAWPANLSHASQSSSFDAKAFVNGDAHTYISPKPDGRPDVSYSVAAPGECFTEWLTDKAIEFIERPRSKPFFYVLSIPDPHMPFTIAPPYDKMFKPEDMEVPATFHQKNLPQWAEDQMQHEVLKDEHATSADDPKRENTLRTRKAQYLGEIKCVDDNVGRILKTLEERGMLENTMIIYTSDHGEFMGEHGLYFKNLMYEPAHHVGMLMCWPGHIAPGTEVHECVANVDLMSTLAGVLGLKTAGKEQGRDASALLLGKKVEWESVAFIHKDNDSQSGLFTEDWELGLAEDGDHVLFDRRKDPHQVNNLYHDPAHAEVVRALTARTIEHNRKVNAPAMKWLATLAT